MRNKLSSMITCVRLTPRFRRVICLIFSFARVMLLGEMPGLPFKSSRWPRNLRSPTADPARDPGHEDIVIYPVEKLFEVELHDKLAPPWATYFRACSSAMWALGRAGIHSWSWKRWGRRWGPVPAGSPVEPDGPQPLEYPIGVVLLPASGSTLHARAGAGKSRPAMQPSTPLCFPVASRPDGGRSSCPPPAFHYWSEPAGTREEGSSGCIPAPSN